MRWLSVLTWAGVGAFLGFAIAVGLYSATGNENFVYLIYLGTLLGGLLGVRYPMEMQASPFAFLLGFLATSLLAVLWTVTDIGTAGMYAFLAVVMALMMLSGFSCFLDMFLAPLTYVGGFGVAMLTFRGYPSLHGSEGAIAGLFTAGIMGAIVVFFGVFARWAFIAARNVTRR
ncbi:hypothetical protein [Thermococcus sp. P6]|uniref:hypothetical protein n=1 Tax=Thermococcus sp. P6 TaxID=122420 RepID=UPI001E596609|nr:hypothetical protein [Thermococcus sp. P6]